MLVLVGLLSIGCDRPIATIDQLRARNDAKSAIQKGHFYVVSVAAAKNDAYSLIKFSDEEMVCEGTFLRLGWWARVVGEEVRIYERDQLVTDDGMDVLRDETGEIRWDLATYKVLPSLRRPLPRNVKESFVCTLYCNYPDTDVYAVSVVELGPGYSYGYVREFNRQMLSFHPVVAEIAKAKRQKGAEE